MAGLTLSDGRALDLRVDGEAGAPALVYLHGTPASGLFPRAIGRAARARGLRLVSWSRSGYATSTRDVGRSVASTVGDAIEVLDHLGIEQTVAFGWSGGGPHVLACAALAPSRFRRVATVAGVGPYVESLGSLDWFAGMGQDNLDEFGAALEGEESLRRWLAPHVEEYRVIRPESIVVAMASLLPEVDRSYLSGETGEELAEGFRDALQVGADGWVDDDLAFTRSWGFDLGAIDVPVTVWQGREDLMVPFAHGAWLVDAVPTARPRLLDGDGHLSIGVGRAEEIVEDLLS
jgi:pimeloyl-ACP methyl ester carboxylesterase